MRVENHSESHVHYGFFSCLVGSEKCPDVSGLVIQEGN